MKQHWYDKIEMKEVICRKCGEKFLTKLSPYFTEYTICLTCEGG